MRLALFGRLGMPLTLGDVSNIVYSNLVGDWLALLDLQTENI